MTCLVRPPALLYPLSPLYLSLLYATPRFQIWYKRIIEIKSQVACLNPHIAYIAPLRGGTTLEEEVVPTRLPRSRRIDLVPLLGLIERTQSAIRIHQVIRLLRPLGRPAIRRQSRRRVLLLLRVVFVEERLGRCRSLRERRGRCACRGRHGR